jgi:hypothetical protein|nr:hypothetical protein Q903MT_gene6536 [Picea sitchensis]
MGECEVVLCPDVMIGNISIDFIDDVMREFMIGFDSLCVLYS